MRLFAHVLDELESVPFVHKSQKGLPLETKNTQNHKNRRINLFKETFLLDIVHIGVVLNTTDHHTLPQTVTHYHRPQSKLLEALKIHILPSKM